MIAFIDGDVLCYQAAWGVENLEEAIERLDQILQGVVESTFSEDYLIALGGESNFREKFFDGYKKSPARLKARKTKPEWFNQLKVWLENNENSVIAYDFEADDLLRMWSVEATRFNIDYIVCSIDKDLDCIPGKHFKPGKDEFYKVTEEEADVHYWKQILMGDSVDNIPGLPRIGEVKALRILESCDNHNNRKAAVINEYKREYGENWKEYLLSNGRLLHIWRHLNDHFKIDEQ